MALPPDHHLQVVNFLDYPDELLRLHQVEWDGAARQLPLGDNPLGDIPDNRGLDQAGLGSVPVQALLGRVEVRGVCRNFLPPLGNMRDSFLLAQVVQAEMLGQGCRQE